MVRLSPCFSGGVWGVKYCWNRATLIYISKLVHNCFPCDILVDNNTFSKMYVFKVLTGYSDDGGYENPNAYILIITIIIIIIIIIVIKDSYIWNITHNMESTAL